MGSDLFHDLSTAELKKEIECICEKDFRSLPEKAKIFSAVAKLQTFDHLPDVCSPEELDGAIQSGDTELNRGISPGKGIPASLYAIELLRGPLYPGTQIAFGQGIYLATPKLKNENPAFPLVSHIALKYAKGGDDSGVIVRCALKKGANTTDKDGLNQFFRENRNRARSAGITDLGTFAASLNFDAYFCDYVYDDTDERVWVVVNRSALIFQRVALQIAGKQD